MGRTMFEDLVVSRPASRVNALRGRVPASIMVHAGGLTALLLFSAIANPGLPKPPEPTVLGTLRAPAAVRTPAPPEPERAPVRVTRASTTQPVLAVMPEAPPAASVDAEAAADPFAASDGPPPCLANCGTSASAGDGVPGDVGPGGGDPDATGTGPSGPVRPGGDVRAPRRVGYTEPVYPDIARRAGVQGIVILECTVGPDGVVRDVRVLRGHPLLDDSARDAVRRWRYDPTRLNGVPVSVIMTVTVHFTLKR